MRIETRFGTSTGTSASLIIVTGFARSARRRRALRLVVDTAATKTTLIPDVVERLGYGARDGDRVTSVTTAIGKEQGFTLRIARLEALGIAVDDFSVNVFDLAEPDDFDGLLGLDFLTHLNYEVRSREGRILAELAA